MNIINLNDLIAHIEYGTNLHISILFFGHYGNGIFHLPRNHTIHSKPVCNAMKTKQNGLKRCFKCRNTAIHKALKTRAAFGGICINGVYEYVHPVFVNNDIVCIIFIGNILNQEKSSSFSSELIDTMEDGYSLEKCKNLGMFIEGFIKMMLPYVTKQTSTNNHSPLISNIKNYIQENICSKNSISYVAELFHYNEKYLGQLFKKETGISYSEYINSVRLEHSKSLLVESNKSVLSIAMEVGYASVTYFNRVFKKHFSLTPKEYRCLFRK